MDIVGPLPAAAAQKKFLLVATDYFTCSAKTLVTQKLKKLGRQLLKEWKLSLTQGNLYKCLDAHLLGALAK
ncbi:hypothetical protein CK203_041533 [Vitis vinifera]|uniref:Uncharacterized protein n=1 Tax=Vitis vinifera TaxID=29760 RepID=A0A438HND7_VITVI|nr:hypothetical protein CK203_041533 [Vitis vinifera]